MVDAIRSAECSLHIIADSLKTIAAAYNTDVPATQAVSVKKSDEVTIYAPSVVELSGTLYRAISHASITDNGGCDFTEVARKLLGELNIEYRDKRSK